VGSALDDVDRDLVAQDLGEGVKQIFVEHIEKLGREFNTSRTTTADNK
jgi:hypothetical protein